MIPKLTGISIDDEELNLLLIEELASKIGLEIKSFSAPEKALEYIKGYNIDIVFVDYLMPGMNGIELIKEIRDYHPDIPIIMITSLSGDEKLKLSAIEAGATEFLTKPFVGSEFLARVTNLSHLREYQILLKEKALLLENEVKKATQDIVKREYETLQVLGNAAERKDPETQNHTTRVGHYCRILAKSVGEDEIQQENVFYASQLHDIGKIGIPDSILLKEGKLTAEEWEIMKNHSLIGFDILKNTESRFLKAGSIVARTHHEKYDGSGYPFGLKGTDIDILGRIVAISDVFDALMTKRPYKDPWPFEKAAELIISEKGRHFDPELVEQFVVNIERMRKITNIFKDY